MRRVLVIVLGVALLTGACDDGPDEVDAEPPATTIDVPLGEITVESVGGPVELPDEVADAVMEGVVGYVTDGVVATLRTGAPEDLTSVFDDATRAGLDGEEGAGMFDRGAPRATAAIVAEAAPVTLVGLADADGALVLVAAQIDLEIEAETDDGTLSIRRTGELVFAPDGFDWKVTAYRMGVHRDGERAETTDEGSET